jgi:hypothetical protein
MNRPATKNKSEFESFKLVSIGTEGRSPAIIAALKADLPCDFMYPAGLTAGHPDHAFGLT